MRETWSSGVSATQAIARAVALTGAALLVVGVAGSACKRESAPASSETSAAGEPTPTATPIDKPEFRESAAAGGQPFSGIREPRDADVDERGRVWITDFGSSHIRVFDPSGGYLGGWGGRGAGTYGMVDPCGIAIRGDTVYIADTFNGRVVSFSLSGAPQTSAAGLYGPRGIAVGADGRVWVSDSGNNRVGIYSASLVLEKFVGRRGSEASSFSGPMGIAVAPKGSVYVADVANHRIQVLSPQGEFQQSLKFPGWTEVCEPHIEVADNGTLYVTDPIANVLVALDESGKELRRWKADDAGNPFLHPTGVAFSARKDFLYVTNASNGTVSSVTLTSKKTT